VACRAHNAKRLRTEPRIFGVAASIEA